MSEDVYTGRVVVDWRLDTYNEEPHYYVQQQKRQRWPSDIHCHGWGVGVVGICRGRACCSVCIPGRPGNAQSYTTELLLFCALSAFTCFPGRPGVPSPKLTGFMQMVCRIRSVKSIRKQHWLHIRYPAGNSNGKQWLLPWARSGVVPTDSASHIRLHIRRWHQKLTPTVAQALTVLMWPKTTPLGR